MNELSASLATGDIDRCTELRGRRDVLAELLCSPGARLVPVWQHRCLMQGNRAALLQPAGLGLSEAALPRLTLLGRRGGHYLFTMDLSDAEAQRVDTGEFRPLRELLSLVPAADAALLAYARAMISWQHQHAHCGRCGAPTRLAEAGFVMACSGADCGQRSFPRLDPAIIVLVQRGARCLLGRQSTWPAGRFSTLAGFVEPGECLEDAVRREVREETAIEVGACRYLGSQPWPFPASLMIGFHADAMSDSIQLSDGELAEARWLTREEIAAGAVTLPPVTSIAFRLIERWFDEGSGPSLSELGITGPPLRVQRPTEAS